MLCAWATVLTLSISVALAADPGPDDRKVQTHEQVYGSEMMTQEERVEYRARMQAARTGEAREQLRKEHHERMKARASARGLSLPDEPPPKDNGMGGGTGIGPGDGGMGLSSGRDR
jgi:hypothetical protein